MEALHTVFNMDNLPNRRLIVQTTLANRFAANVGREIFSIRENLAREIAQKCIECDDLVQIVADGHFVKVQADCIVMTSDELAALMKKQFSAGLEHARGFMPTYESGALAAKPADKKGGA